MKTFVINLQKRPDRLENFMNNVGRHLKDFDIEIIQAVDGELYDPESERNKINSWNFRHLSERRRKSVIACCKSHLMAFEKLINSDFPHALIFEDDAFPVVEPETLGQEIKNINLPENFGLIYLNRWKKPINNPTTPSLSPIFKGETAESYILSRKFALYSYDILANDMGAFDRHLEMIIENKKNIPEFEFYVANRQLFYQNNRADTDIQRD